MPSLFLLLVTAVPAASICINVPCTLVHNPDEELPANNWRTRGAKASEEKRQWVRKGANRIRVTGDVQERLDGRSSGA